jgi:transcriptional regulator with XRE-family HTH domain
MRFLMAKGSEILTGEQLRAARAMLKMEQAELAKLSGISIDTIKRLERVDGPLHVHARTLHNLRSAFEEEGVIFIRGSRSLPGVALRRDPPPVIRARHKRGRPRRDRNHSTSGPA